MSNEKLIKCEALVKINLGLIDGKEIIIKIGEECELPEELAKKFIHLGCAKAKNKKIQEKAIESKPDPSAIIADDKGTTSLSPDNK